MVRPTSWVPAGMSDEIERDASPVDGPSSSALTAAVATAFVLGMSRRTARIPALPSAPSSQKLARTTVVAAAGLADGFGDEPSAEPDGSLDGLDGLDDSPAEAPGVTSGEPWA